MSVTAFFVFANNCPACAMFKNAYYPNVLKLFKELGMNIEDATAEDTNGFGNTKLKYEFIKQITFYPCIFLVKTEALEMYEKGEIADEILNYIYIWNGVVLPNKNAIRVVTIN